MLSYSVGHAPHQASELAEVADLGDLQVVASTAGQAVGPLVAVPLARRHGRSFIFFWSMVGLLGTGIWSATMTRSDEYNAFIVARLCGGFFGGNPVALGADALIDIYFLHQRGKAFTVLNLSFLSGVVIGPTFSGFIVELAPWPVQFWWTNGLEAATIILALVFLEDTYYDRAVTDKADRILAPEKFVANRVATFFCGARLVPPISWAETVSLLQYYALSRHRRAGFLQHVNLADTKSRLDHSPLLLSSVSAQ